MSKRKAIDIVLRSVIKFSHGPLRSEQTNWVQTRINTRNGADDILFEPVRQRTSDLAEEWYVHSDAHLQVQYRLRHSLRPQWVFRPTFQLSGPLRILVAELEPRSRYRDRFQLVGGSLSIELGEIRNPLWTLWTRQISDLWPTGRFEDIAHIHIEPSGAHLQGYLPEGFYPNRVRKPVVLRVPRDDADFLSAAETPLRPELDDRPIWRLTSHPFEGVDLTSRSYVSESVGVISNFRLPTTVNRKARSFIDSARVAPGEDCQVGVFSVVNTEDSRRRLDWLASEINTSLNLGGAGTTETTFVPDSLYGMASERNDGSETDRIVRLESLADASSDSELTLDLDEDEFTLDLAEDGTVGPNGTIKMRAIAQPVAPINLGSDDTNEKRFRSWLCTASGWAQFDSVHAKASIDPKRVSQGPMLGALEIGRLITKLQDRSTGDSGLSLQMQSLRSSSVSVILSESAAYKQLTLSITNPMTTLVSPPVFFREPIGVGRAGDDGGTLQSIVPSLTSGEGLLEDVDEAELSAKIQKLDREIGSRFEAATFVSKNVTEDKVEAPAGATKVQIRTLQTVVRFEVASDAQMELEFDAESTTLWHRPNQTPLVRNFPWPTSQDGNTFLDANRGMLPFRLSDSGQKVVMRFPDARLPESAATPELDKIIAGAGDWVLDGRAMTCRMFLPTLPGVELETTENPPLWQYRFAVPILDEAYGEAAESPDASRGQSPLPDGFDPTRVSVTVAFRLEDTELTGLMPPTDENQQGDLRLQVVSADLRGRMPSIELQVQNRDGNGIIISRTLSRQQNIAGLDLPIVVTPRTGDDFPSFKVVLGDISMVEEDYLDTLRRNGQPLLGTFDTASNRVRTQDGVGRICEYGEDALERSRKVGNDALSVRLVDSAMINDAFVLDILGVDILDKMQTPPSVPSEARSQSWLLRSADGTHAQIAGFPILPRRLLTPSRSADSIKVTVEAVVMHRLVDAENEGAGQVLLTLEKPNGGAWALKQIEGTIDWRFAAPPDDFSQTSLTRLTGTIASSQDDPDTITIELDEVEVYSPTGFIRFELARTATLASGTLTVPDGPPVDPPTTIGFGAFLGAFDVNEGDVDPPALSSTDLFWTNVDASANLRSNLALRSGLWSLSVIDTNSDSKLVEVALDALSSETGKILFRSRENEPLATTVPECWFQRSASDFAMLAANFPQPTTVKFIAGEVLIHLQGRDANPHVQAKLGITLSLNVGTKITLEPTVSGELKLRNHIGFERAGTAGTHRITLTMDRSAWPLESIFFGRGPEDSEPCHSIAHHRLHIGDSVTNWTVPQPVILRTQSNYSRTFLDTIVDDQSLVVDAGWVFLLGDPIEIVANVEARGSLELDLPRLESQWRLRPLTDSAIGFGNRISHVTRLPFACDGPAPTFALPLIELDDTAAAVDLILPDSGAQMLQFAPEQLPTLAADTLTFVRRGPLAHWFDERFLADIFTSFDDDMLPAFEDNGVVTNRLPGRLADLKWLNDGGGSPINGTLRAASLRTPYVPRDVPVALVSSSLAVFPFILSADVSESAAPSSTSLQLLTVGTRNLQRIARQHIEIGGMESAEILWARQELSARRRDEAALLLKDFTEVIKVQRGISITHRERPRWPTLPIAKQADGANSNPPNARIDRRRVEPDGTRRFQPTAEGGVTVFAGRPEPGESEPAGKAVAATRFRMAAELGGILQKAKVEEAYVNKQDDRLVLVDGTLQSMTKAEDVPFEVSDPRGTPNDWQRLPSPGPEVWAVRTATPGSLPEFDISAAATRRPIQTIRTPLTDIVTWARRPGELCRTTVFEESVDFTSPNSPVVSLAAPREITLRRPRALAGPDEAVRLHVVEPRAIIRNKFQYTRLRVEQRIAFTDPPEPADIYGVLTGKSEIFPSSANVPEAATLPAIVRVSMGKVEKSNLSLIAHGQFIPQVKFSTGEIKMKTILIANRDSSIPDIDRDDPPPEAILFGENNDRDAIESSDFEPITDNIRQLLVDHRRLLSLLHDLLISGAETGYLQVLQYFRDEPSHDWTAPEHPLMALYVVAIDATREFVKPKMGLAILRGKDYEEPIGFGLAGYGRLEDDDFTPILAQTSGSPERIAWTRTANVQSLDRIDDPTVSEFAYDIVLYGPGGELIPTEQ